MVSRATLAVGATALVCYAVYRYLKRRDEQLEKARAGGADQAKSRPKLVVVFSGKRKSGKDYVTDRLVAQVEALAGAGVCEVGRLSGPLKKAYADENGLDYKELLSDGPYKEKYRADMIVWGERKRNEDPGYFARLVVDKCAAPVLVISDARRPTDLAFFQDGVASYGWRCLTVRVAASDAARSARQWKFTPKVDDVQSECGLDGRQWNVVFQNDGPAAEALSETGEAEAAPGGGGSGDGGSEEARASVGGTASAVSAWSTPAVRGGIGLQITSLAHEIAGFALSGEFSVPVREDVRASN